MYGMKYLFCFLTICFLFPIKALIAQEKWSFDNTNPLLSDDGNFSLNLHTVKESHEFVDGIVGKAVRTDGYSTYLETIINQPVSSVSGWFALESYPTDTATFIGVQDVLGNSITVSTDRFGDLSIGIGKDSSFVYYSLDTKIKPFKWLHLLLDLNGKAIYLNGKKLISNYWQELLLGNEIQIQVGRDFREKKLWMYNVTSINGLIDEIEIADKPVDVGLLQESIVKHIEKCPVLAIPEIRFAKDFNRPRYHLLPSANWTNETHGLFYYKGKYHIFNQKNASAIFLGQINWGHFTSSNLLYWTEEKPALTPDNAYDKNGIWSGHAVINDDDIPKLIYTAGGDKLGVALAFPKDSSLIEWRKYEGNPVIAQKPTQYTRTDMRDQYVWKEAGTWYMIIGFGIEKINASHGALLLYKSADLKKWDFVHLLFEGNPEVDHSGVFWEMPVFKKMGNKYVLLVNRVPHNGVPARCQYWIGDFKNEKFIPDNLIPQNLEVINRLLSPSVVETPEGDVAAIAIIPDEIGGEATYEQGWAHLYSIPRRWQLKNGKLCQNPHPVMKHLREKYMLYPKRKLTSTKPYVVSRDSHQVEVKMTFYPGDAKRFGFTLCKNPDNSEFSMIYYDVEKQELVLDQTHSSQRAHIPLEIRKDHYQMNKANPVEIHLFIDGSVVEGFINNEDTFTTRIFPLKKNSTQLELFSDGNTTEATAEVWNLKDAKVHMNF